MKTFLNVLYRRILYKIPLKFLLVLLAITAIFIASFSSAGFEIKNTFITAPNQSAGYSTFNIAWSEFTWADLFCYDNRLGDDQIGYSLACDGNYTYLKKYEGFCLYKSEASSFCIRQVNAGVVSWGYFDSSYLNSPYTSLQCQTEYNLIPISSVDQNYCTTNNLCPSQECPSVPVGTGNLSQLYINNILHVGAPTILMDIPDEIDWDYEYTMGGNVMNIDIVGYNVDYDKINEQINLQNFKPSSEDLSQVVSGIIPLFVPGLCIILLLYFIFRFIKKIF